MLGPPMPGEQIRTGDALQGIMSLEAQRDEARDHPDCGWARSLEERGWGL